MMQTSVVRNPMRSDATWPAPSDEPTEFHRRLPGYAPTPLHDQPALAASLGVGRLLVKDESSRLGLPAFKILGASWAIYTALRERLPQELGTWHDIDELAALVAPIAPLTLATATDGNHGRAVAHVARLLGLNARVWVPANTSSERIAAIADEGAEVVVSRGSYDQAVREAAASAGRSTLVISDTSWSGYTKIPERVIEGYGTILREIDTQLRSFGLGDPDVVVVPVGVGALAAAVAQHYRRDSGESSTLLVGVEPTSAACVTASLVAGEPVTLRGTQDSVMAGLNCGTPSRVAWARLSSGFDFLVTVTDDQAEAAVRMLGEHGVVAGESGAASLAGWIQVAPDLVAAGRVPREMSVMLLSTEGATDAAAYRRITGRDPGTRTSG